MYIFNKHYKFKNDIHRIIIVNNPEYSKDTYLSFIHPVYAWVLNLFDGNTEHDLIVKKIMHTLNISEEDVQNLITLFVTNSKEIIIRYDGVISVIPPYVLLKNTEKVYRAREEDDFFNICGTVNHKDWRLFKPINLLICPTLRCFTDCVYCYADRKHQHKELPSQKWVDFIDESRKYGIERIDVTGGEFFLIKGWQEIALALTSNGYFPDISTKIPLSGEVLEDIKINGLRSLQYSLDTLDPLTASQTLNVKNDYIYKLKESIQYADKIGLRLILKPTLSISTCNTENIKAILDFASTLKNVERVVISVIGFSCYKPPHSYPKIRPTLHQVNQLRIWLRENIHHYPFPVIDDTFIYTAQEMRNEKVFSERARCTANVEGFVVLPDGTATICEELYWIENFIIGNISASSIGQIWNSPESRKLQSFSRSDIPETSKCIDCGQLDSCHKQRGVCWKLVVSAYGKNNPFQADPRCPLAPTPKNPFTIN